jgi:hypothetical protein
LDQVEHISDSELDRRQRQFVLAELNVKLVKWGLLAIAVLGFVVWGVQEWVIADIKSSSGHPPPVQLFRTRVPMWLVGAGATLGSLLAWWLGSWLRRVGRFYYKLCPGCRYDRRGLSDDAPCPECGSPARSRQ